MEKIARSTRGDRARDAELSAELKAMMDGGRMEATTDISGAVQRSTSSWSLSRHGDDCERARSGMRHLGFRGDIKGPEGAAGGPGITTFPDNRGSDAADTREGRPEGWQDFGLAYCPNVQPGDREHTLEKVNRVLGNHARVGEVTRALYATIIVADVRVLRKHQDRRGRQNRRKHQRTSTSPSFNEFALYSKGWAWT